MPTRRNLRTLAAHPAVLAVTLAVAAGLATVPAQAAPDVSLKEMMKKMQAQVLNGDAKPLAPIFEATKAKAKPEFASWGAMSDKGKAAAASGDLDGAKATCKECHDAYRNDYKMKYGSKAP
jgi:hypothetical protein